MNDWLWFEQTKHDVSAQNRRGAARSCSRRSPMEIPASGDRVVVSDRVHVGILHLPPIGDLPPVRWQSPWFRCRSTVRSPRG